MALTEVEREIRGVSMKLRHHMNMTRTDIDEDGEPVAHVPHPTRSGVLVEPPEVRWHCTACSQEGTMDELDALDCPKGLAPYYDVQNEPEEVFLAERDVGTHIEKYIVSRLEIYERDERYERAKALKDSPRAEVLRRLGALDGRWKPYSKIDGTYIGDVGLALIKRNGVAPQGARPESRNCSIGFSEREQKWYGWSHRAQFGFGIGYVVEEGSTCATSGYIDGYLEEHPEEDRRVPVGFECKTLDDCKRCAIAHADSVG